MNTNKDFEIGDIDSINLDEPRVSRVTEVNKNITKVLKQKTQLHYFLFCLILITFVPVIAKEYVSEVMLGYVSLVVFGIASFLCLGTLVLIFIINKNIHSIGYAIFRAAISVVPIITLYIVYRTTHDVNQFVKGS